MNQAEAAEFIAEYMSSKNIKTVRGEIKHLKTLTSHEDREVVRQATHMLKYAEAQVTEEEFHKFLRSEWTQVKGKRSNQLSRSEIKEAQIHFERVSKK